VLMQTLSNHYTRRLPARLADETISPVKTLLKVKFATCLAFIIGILPGGRPHRKVRGRRASADQLNERHNDRYFWFGFAGKCANVLRLGPSTSRDNSRPSRIGFAADYETQSRSQHATSGAGVPTVLTDKATAIGNLSEELLTKCESPPSCGVRIDQIEVPQLRP